jgi:hypothetical protein
MSLFFDVLSSINNPNQNGSVEQLAAVAQGIQKVSAQHNVPASSMASVMSALGPALGTVLKDKGASGNLLQGAISQIASGNTSASQLQSIITPQMQQQIAQAVSQKSGMSGNVVQAMLPMLLPVVMNLFNMGSNRPGTAGMNPLLNAFLSGKAGSGDLGHVMKFANRFLQSA